MSSYLCTVDYHDGHNTVSLQRKIDRTSLDQLTDKQRETLDTLVNELLDLVGGYRDDAAAVVAAQLVIDEHIERAYETEAHRRGVLPL